MKPWVHPAPPGRQRVGVATALPCAQPTMSHVSLPGYATRAVDAAPPAEPAPSVAPSRTMKRLVQAPNAALATLWADMLRQGGIEASVQRYFASGIAGEIPPDQALPEVWIADDSALDAARALLQALRHPPSRHWLCRACGETVDGPFDQCWNCGAPMPT